MQELQDSNTNQTQDVIPQIRQSKPTNDRKSVKLSSAKNYSNADSLRNGKSNKQGYRSTGEPHIPDVDSKPKLRQQGRQKYYYNANRKFHYYTQKTLFKKTINADN